ncbi:uncharacterized protein LOC119377101 isoform X2 [Rhipicephalus sanguineus]|uniref:uncharacterized protein LOC119377101 isoform X2 n=1 Tax=Rhipicephalus sanguineus TaxID=34632 RepID=UPI0020C22C22|nr:uncharacterized protein LOC119377101 isoform X2 [Rhipicephalus sanguineus]
MQKLAADSERLGSTIGSLPNSVSKEADTRPYEEIEFKKDPQCVACGTSSRMKCIWLNDAEFSFLRYQPWQCLRCAVNHSFETAGGGSQAARRNLCIWFTRVTRLKANYTELQCKMLSSSCEGQRLHACSGRTQPSLHARFVCRLLTLLVKH